MSKISNSTWFFSKQKKKTLVGIELNSSKEERISEFLQFTLVQAEANLTHGGFPASELTPIEDALSCCEHVEYKKVQEN